MSWRSIIWSAKCLGFCMLGVFLCGQITRSLSPPIWWVLHRAQATYLNLLVFQFKYFFLFRALYGFLLGLMPTTLLIEALRSVSGLLRTQAKPREHPEVDWRRPILWAWVPLALAFLVRFATWQAPDRTVLSAPDYFERLHYFFDPMALANMNFLAPQASVLVFDMVTITGPMVFMLAYTTGVWLRHQRPGVDEAMNSELAEEREVKQR